MKIEKVDFARDVFPRMSNKQSGQFVLCKLQRVIDEFISSENACAKVVAEEFESRSVKSLRSGLLNAAKTLNVKCIATITLDGELYLINKQVLQNQNNKKEVE